MAMEIDRRLLHPFAAKKITQIKYCGQRFLNSFILFSYRTNSFAWKASGSDFEKCLSVTRFILLPFKFFRPCLSFFRQRLVVH